jgi:mannose-6-phosphate isomerase-like protein (cupin superfamily)
MDKINLAEKFNLFEDHWSPKIIGELNNSYIKVVKLKDEFVWHHHDNEDELFLVVKGTMVMRLKENDNDDTIKEIKVEPGELIIIPKGVEHMPIAVDEVHVMLMEPKSTLNTGNIKNERTVEELKTI